MELDNLRYWGDEAPPDVAERARESIALMKARPDRAENPSEPIVISLLAISGGGENGAFGAGFLTGWSETGARPQFQAVTGVSTGALIAPFAFLGADYDSTLEAAYTETTPADMVISPFLRGRIAGPHAVSFSFMAGVIPPMPMFGRWLLYVHSHRVAWSLTSSIDLQTTCRAIPGGQCSFSART